MYYGVNISFLQITDNGSLTLFDHQKSDGPLKKKKKLIYLHTGNPVKNTLIRRILSGGRIFLSLVVTEYMVNGV